MRRLAHVAVRRDPNTGTWWWVCIDPECRLEEGIAVRLEDHHAAIVAATSHVAAAKLRTPSVNAATPAAADSGRGAAGGEQ